MELTLLQRQREAFVMGYAPPMRPAKLSRFERKVKSLHLAETEYASSRALRKWVLKYKDRRFVPEGLLVAYGFTVHLPQEYLTAHATARIAFPY